MPEFSSGFKSMKFGEIDPVTGLAAVMNDVGKVYRDSAELTVEDANKIQHFSELDDDPVVIMTRKGLKSLRFRLMDTEASNLVKWLGGTVVTVVDEPDQWEEPDGTPVIEYAIEYEHEDGTIYGIRRGRIDAKLIPDPKRSGFTVIEVMVTVLKPLVDGLKSTYKRNRPVA